MEKFFPAEKIIMTGNPVRQNLLGHSILHADAVKYFGLNPEKKTILILGGSLGARTINQTLTAGLDVIRTHPDLQFIWQTGKIYIDQVREAITATTGEAVRNPHISAIPNLYVTDFIKDMANAYAAADLVISLPEPVPSPSSACCTSRSSWFPHPMWPKTIRPRMRWRWWIRMQLSM